MKKSVYTLMAILVFASCDKTTRLQSVNDNYDIINIVNAMSKPEVESFSEYVEDVHVVRLETNDKCFVGLINQLIVTDDRIIIFDEGNKENQILIFDKEGHFVNTIKRGQGPTEIVKAYHIAYDYDKDEIVISQHSFQSFFNKNGDFIKSKRNDIFCGEFVKYKDDFILKVLQAQKNYIKGDYYNYEILVTDSNYNVKSFGLPFYNEVSLSTQKELFVTKDGVLITRMFNDTIFRYASGGISPAYVLQYSNKKYESIPQDDEELFETEEQSGYCFCSSFENNATHQCLCLDNDADNLYIYAVRNIQTNNIIWREISSDQFFVGNRFFVIPETSFKDYYATALYAEDVHNKRENIKCAFSPEELKKIDDMGEEDNPAIVFYKFKVF